MKGIRFAKNSPYEKVCRDVLVHRPVPHTHSISVTTSGTSSAHRQFLNLDLLTQCLLKFLRQLLYGRPDRLQRNRGVAKAADTAIADVPVVLIACRIVGIASMTR